MVLYGHELGLSGCAGDLSAEENTWKKYARKSVIEKLPDIIRVIRRSLCSMHGGMRNACKSLGCKPKRRRLLVAEGNMLDICNVLTNTNTTAC